MMYVCMSIMLGVLTVMTSHLQVGFIANLNSERNHTIVEKVRIAGFIARLCAACLEQQESLRAEAGLVPTIS